MSLTTRQDAILKTLRTKGSIDVDALAVDWNITTQTVRRDLTVLCDAGLAVRTHGGAKQAPLSTAIAYESRRLRNTKAKQTIAKTTASLIPDGASLALNIGTTTELVAEHLRLHRALTVVTNNTNIVPILRTSPIKSLILIGGEIRLSDGAVVGGDALDTIGKYRVDFAVIGASCIDPNGAILDFDQREVMVARALLNAARTKILVADSSKFEATAPHKICDVGDLDTVILDAPPPDTFAKALSKANTNLLIANEPYND